MLNKKKINNSNNFNFIDFNSIKMLFKRVISKEGWELRLHKEHELFKNPIFKEFNFDDHIEISYCDLYLLAFNNTEYSLLKKEEISSHLELLDKICFVNKQKELLDYAIKEYNDDIDKWKSFINPSIIELNSEYLLTFPDLIDYNLEVFSKLKDCDDLKRQKLLEYAQDDNIESFSILFDLSLVNKDFLKELFKYGFIGIIIDKKFNNCNWNQCMKWAAYKGNKILVEFFINKGADDWNIGMLGAAKGGHKDLVDFFISKGENNWNGGIYYAAREGHKDLVNFFIKKGADDWNWGMIGAAEGGHKELVDFFIKKGAKHWNSGMYAACKAGNKDLIDFFIEKGADDWNYVMYAAAKGGHKILVEFFINKGADDWNWGMEGAAEGGFKDLIDFFIEKGANDRRNKL